MNAPENRPTSQGSDFARLGSEQRSSFVSDFIYLLKTNRKWWMLPLVLILVGFGGLMILASTGAAPFIYTLF